MIAAFFKNIFVPAAALFAGAVSVFGNAASDVYENALRERSATWKNIPEDRRDAAIARLKEIYEIMRVDNDDGFCLRNGFVTDFKTALGDYEDFIKEFAATPFAAEALYQKSVIYTQAHMFEDGFECVEQLVNIWPGSDRVGDALIQGFFICEALRQGARQRRFGGYLPWFIDREAVLDFYDRLYKLGPKSPVAPRVLFQKGCLSKEISENFFKGDLKQDAIDAFEMLIATHPDSPLVPEAYLHLAGTYRSLCVGDVWDQLAARRALNYYTDFYSLFPERDEAEFAYEQTEELRELIASNRLAVGDFYYKRRNNIRAATEFYNEAVSVAPDSESAKTARSRIADIADGKRAGMTIIDWIFGRYPAPVTKDFLDKPSQRSLDQMGFQTAGSLERSSENNGNSAVESTTEERESDRSGEEFRKTVPVHR